MNSYNEFLQAITELYDQNKLDFNNYKLLKKELESIENEHEKQKSEYRNYFRMLESKIKNLVVSGGGLGENQVQNIVSNYFTTHKSELTGARGEKGEKGEQGLQGTDGLTTQIRVNGTTYTQSNGLITLPDYPSSNGGSGTIDTSNFIIYNNSYISDCNLHYVNGYTKTNTITRNLPSSCNGSNAWGILFCIMENITEGTGIQMFFPVDGTYKGKIFIRSIIKLKVPSLAKTSPWSLLGVDASVVDVGIDDHDEMN